MTAGTVPRYEGLREPFWAGFGKRVGAWLIDSAILFFVGIVVGLITGPMADHASLIMGLLINWAYYAGMESSRFRGTPGKMVLGIAVVGYDGDTISLWRATIRYFTKYISAAILLMGFLMVLWTARKQGLHDVMASTLVVDQSRQ